MLFNCSSMSIGSQLYSANILKTQKLQTCRLFFQSTLPSMERPDLVNRRGHEVDCQVPDIP